jgi:hypothetical protein
MLRVKSIADDGENRRLYSIHVNGEPVDAETLASVARIACRLVAENELPGTYRAGEGSLVLDLPAAQRSFFHDGIVFAAIDAVNDPVHSPTLTRIARDPRDGTEGG